MLITSLIFYYRIHKPKLNKIIYLKKENELLINRINRIENNIYLSYKDDDKFILNSLTDDYNKALSWSKSAKNRISLKLRINSNIAVKI